MSLRMTQGDLTMAAPEQAGATACGDSTSANTRPQGEGH